MNDRKGFEEWALALLGKKAKVLMSFDATEGYKDETINAMWIGWNGHASMC